VLGQRELRADDYLALVRRRLWLIVIPAMLGSVIGYSGSLLLHERYTSQTLVLVEQQRVPESYVKSVVTEELNERLTTMQQQILSRTRLQPIIEKFGMYKEDLGRVPMEDLLNRLRGGILVTAVRTTGNQPGRVSGFYISFTADNPQLAQQVCAEITSMFMEENIRLREQRAEGTTQFLAKQLEEAKLKLDGQDAKLADFKRRYIGQLPGEEQTNLSLLMALNTQLEGVTQSLNRAQQDKLYLHSILAQQLTRWQASQTGSNPQTAEQELAALQSLLVTLEARYTSHHPDVIKLKNDIAQLKRKVAETNTTATPSETPTKAAISEPPEVLQLRSQLHQLEVTVVQQTREQQRLQQQIKLYQDRVQLSPLVEQQYKELTRDYTNALLFYNDLLSKRNQSEMATDLERRQQGEQFRVMDPPNLPGKPSYPDRRLFAAIGLAVGLMLGLGVAVLLEARDKSLRTERDIEFFLQLPTLALLPLVDAKNGSRKGFWKRAKKQLAPAEQRVEA